jgi:hypothetical protein
LHFEAAGASDLAEHLGLQLASSVPGLLTAGGGIEGEDDAAASTTSSAGKLFDLGEEAIEL